MIFYTFKTRIKVPCLKIQHVFFKFFINRISLQETSNYKFFQLIHVKIKIIIIIVLKSNLKIGLGQSMGQWSRPELLVGVTRE
jgi:hypothetical protein